MADLLMKRCRKRHFLTADMKLTPCSCLQMCVMVLMRLGMTVMVREWMVPFLIVCTKLSLYSRKAKISSGESYGLVSPSTYRKRNYYL